MACYHPIPAWQSPAGDVFLYNAKGCTREFKVPCGVCIGCVLERSRQWAIRCCHEASLYDSNCFVTLTYDESCCPVSLDYSHFQRFMKRLRARSRVRMRFYMCGEYGERFSRPHFHACLFNFDFPDKAPLTKELFRSPLLEDVWPHGFSSIGPLNFRTASYVARYVTGKFFGWDARQKYSMTDVETGEVTWRVAPFNHMSLRPGIGAAWLRKFQSDVYPAGTVISSEGRRSAPPRYYDKVYSRSHPLEFEALRSRRRIDALANVRDRRPGRLAVREVVARAALSFKKRSI